MKASTVLFWSADHRSGKVCVNGLKITLAAKPDLGFEFSSLAVWAEESALSGELAYQVSTNNADGKVVKQVLSRELNEAELSAVADFLKPYGLSNDSHVVHGVHPDGTYAGLVPRAGWGGRVAPTAPPEASQYRFGEAGGWFRHRGLAERQAIAWARIQGMRGRVQAGGVLVGAYWFHTDDQSRLRYLDLIRRCEAAKIAGLSEESVLQAGDLDIVWKTMSGQSVPMTVGLAEKVQLAVSDHDIAAFMCAESHKAAMFACDEPGEYDCGQGWPRIFLSSSDSETGAPS